MDTHQACTSADKNGVDHTVCVQTLRVDMFFNIIGRIATDAGLQTKVHALLFCAQKA